MSQEGRPGEAGGTGTQGKDNGGSQEVAAPGSEGKEEEEEKGKWVQDLERREPES